MKHKSCNQNTISSTFKGLRLCKSLMENVTPASPDCESIEHDTNSFLANKVALIHVLYSSFMSYSSYMI